MSKTNKSIGPKVLDYLLIVDNENRNKREGIELVEVYPGRWDINISDKLMSKSIRHSMLRFTGDDELVMQFGKSNKVFVIDKPSEIPMDQLGNEIRKFMSKRKFCNTCTDKAIEYLLKAIELHKGYLNKVYY